MIKLKNISEDRLDEIGKAFSDYEYEMGERGLFYCCKGSEGVREYIKGFTKAGVASGLAYTNSEREEGYIIISSPESNFNMASLKILISSFVRSMGWKGMFRFFKDIKNAGESLESKLKKEKKNFIMIEMLVVREEFQNQGYMRELIQIAFDMADEKNALCIVSTDGKIKAKKYQHLGFEPVNVRKFPGGACEYDLIRYPKEKEK